MMRLIRFALENCFRKYAACIQADEENNCSVKKILRISSISVQFILQMVPVTLDLMHTVLSDAETYNFR